MDEQVVVTNIKMPFWAMVAFMVKWALASIPAFIILFFLTVLSVGIFRAFIASFGT